MAADANDVAHSLGRNSALGRSLARARRTVRPVDACAGAFVLLVIVTGVFAGAIAPHDPTLLGEDSLASPSVAHPFGTDPFGRDILSRTIWGSRTLVVASVGGIGIALAVGVPLGVVAGYAGRTLNSILMRIVDVLLAFPSILLALIVVTIMGSGLTQVTVAIGVSFVGVFARVSYGAAIAVKQSDYIAAARVIGCSKLRVMARHILPNIASQIIVVATTAIGWAMVVAATLNFLGLGVRLPTPDWGADLAAGKEWLNTAWWMATFPGIAITLTVLAINYLGDWLVAMLGSRTRADR